MDNNICTFDNDEYDVTIKFNDIFNGNITIKDKNNSILNYIWAGNYNDNITITCTRENLTVKIIEVKNLNVYVVYYKDDNEKSINQHFTKGEYSYDIDSLPIVIVSKEKEIKEIKDVFMVVAEIDKIDWKKWPNIDKYNICEKIVKNSENILIFISKWIYSNIVFECFYFDQMANYILTDVVNYVKPLIDTTKYVFEYGNTYNIKDVYSLFTGTIRNYGNEYLNYYNIIGIILFAGFLKAICQDKQLLKDITSDMFKVKINYDRINMLEDEINEKIKKVLYKLISNFENHGINGFATFTFDENDTNINVVNHNMKYDITNVLKYDFIYNGTTNVKVPYINRMSDNMIKIYMILRGDSKENITKYLDKLDDDVIKKYIDDIINKINSMDNDEKLDFGNKAKIFFKNKANKKYLDKIINIELIKTIKSLFIPKFYYNKTISHKYQGNSTKEILIDIYKIYYNGTPTQKELQTIYEKSKNQKCNYEFDNLNETLLKLFELFYYVINNISKKNNDMNTVIEKKLEYSCILRDIQIKLQSLFLKNTFKNNEKYILDAKFDNFIDNTTLENLKTISGSLRNGVFGLKNTWNDSSDVKIKREKFNDFYKILLENAISLEDIEEYTDIKELVVKYYDYFKGTLNMEDILNESNKYINQ